jgi:SAM-dependent methyltransferase
MLSGSGLGPDLLHCHQMFPGLTSSHEIGDPAAFIGGLRSSENKLLYATTLQVQSEVTAAATRSFLGSLDAWQEAKTVLDVGCGPGTLPANFEDLLAGKAYTGLDVDETFLIWAQKRVPEGPSRRFVLSDLHAFSTGSFDAIILWAVLQHLPDLRKAVLHLRSLMSPGGVLIFFDSGDPQAVRINPDVPTFSELYAEFTRKSQQVGRNNRCLEQLERIAPDLGLSVLIREDINLLVREDTDKQKNVTYILLLSELIRRFYGIEADQRRLFDELELWRGQPGSTFFKGDGRWVVLGRDEHC